MRWFVCVWLLGAIVGVGWIAHEPRHAGADDPAKSIAYRNAVMSSIGAHITAISSVVKGDTAYVGHVAAHAKALADALGMIPDVFPAGTDQGATRAKAEIWTDWENFEAAATASQEAATKLAEIAASGDVRAIGAQLNEVGKTCGTCHRWYRKDR